MNVWNEKKKEETKPTISTHINTLTPCEYIQVSISENKRRRKLMRLV
jgi:DNA-binding MarR family transcriptional regulator